MKNKVLVLSISLILILSYYNFTKNSNSVKKQWDLQKKKIWETFNTGDDPIYSIQNIQVSNNGNVYCQDRKSFKIHIFDKNGKHIRSFGKNGEGPGEMKRMGSLFLTNKKLIISISGNLHYYSLNGNYLKKIKIPNTLTPRYFINENTFISAPYMNWKNPEKKSKIILYQINQKKSEELFGFYTYKKGVIHKKNKSGRSSFSYSHSSLTPMMVVFGRNNKLLYGMNNKNKINIFNLKRKTTFYFNIENKKKPVPTAFKKEILKDIDFPPEIKKEMIKGFPNFYNLFESIHIDEKNFIYVFKIEPKYKFLKTFNIYNAKGKYLYRSEIRVEKEYSIIRQKFNKDSLYLALEDQDGEIILTKYKILLPEH